MANTKKLPVFEKLVPADFVQYVADELKTTIEQIDQRYDWPTLKGLQKAVEAFKNEGHKDHGKYSELPKAFINGISQCLESQSDAAATLAMREAFSEAWHSASKIEEREALIRFVANTWGGMGLRKETVRELAEQYAKEPGKLKGGKARIPSRSKILASIDPEERFIYDSRVSKALYSFWSIREKKVSGYPVTPFPKLRGRGDPADADAIAYKKPFRYEEVYCRFIKEVGDALARCDGFKNEKPRELRQKVEMALFILSDKAGKEVRHE